MPIIHLGYPKTGTTWFQDKFFPYVPNYYYVSKEISNDLFSKPDAFSFDRQTTIEKVKQLTQNKDVILSSELFAGTINRGWLRGLWSKETAIRLHSVLPSAKIVVFIRRQEELIASAYLQYIKNGGNFSINRYLKSYSYNLFSFEHLNFYNLLQFYETLFGKKNMQIFLFEDFRNDNIDFVKEFSARLGIDIDFANIDFTPVNESIPAKLIALKRFSNLFYYKMFPYKHYLFPIPGWNNIQEKIYKRLSASNTFRQKSDYKYILGDRWVKFIKEYYKESNRALLKDYELEGMRKHNYTL
jgi:hypothetical protein